MRAMSKNQSRKEVRRLYNENRRLKKQYTFPNAAIRPRPEIGLDSWLMLAGIALVVFQVVMLLLR